MGRVMAERVARYERLKLLAIQTDPDIPQDALDSGDVDKPHCTTLRRRGLVQALSAARSGVGQSSAPMSRAV